VVAPGGGSVSDKLMGSSDHAGRSRVALPQHCNRFHEATLADEAELRTPCHAATSLVKDIRVIEGVIRLAEGALEDDLEDRQRQIVHSAARIS
jgi:hypothetical protein